MSTIEQVSKESFHELYVSAWNSVVPQEMKSLDEVRSEFLLMPEGAFFKVCRVGEGGILLVYDRDGEQPPGRVHVEVHIPASEEHLISSALDQAESAVREAGVPKVSAWTGSMHSALERNLLDRGFTIAQVAPVSRLELGSFDIESFKPELDRYHSSGFSFSTIKELEDLGYDWIPELYDASWEMIQDMPHTYEPTRVSLEHFREIMTEPVGHDPNFMFITMHDGRVVGYSRVAPSQGMSGLVRTGLSGVVRSHRRQGIVSAMKALSLQRLKELGYKWVQTDNDETNPMFQINLHLGFQEVWRWKHFEKDVVGTS